MRAGAGNARLRLWKLEQLKGVDFLYGAGVTHFYPPHLHEEYCLQLVLRGTERTIRRGESFTAYPGDLSLMNPDEVHSTDSVRSEYKMIRIRPHALAPICPEIFGAGSAKPRFPLFVDPDRATYRSLLRLLSKLEQKLSFLEQESEFVSAIAQLFGRLIPSRTDGSREGKGPDRVRLVREYIRAHYAENISLSALSSLTGLSSFHLLRSFRRQVGIPPHEYQTQLRIAHARKLLSAGHAISAAAAETGFCDQSHFARNFKRIVAMTPGRYLSESNIVQDQRK